MFLVDLSIAQELWKEIEGKKFQGYWKCFSSDHIKCTLTVGLLYIA